MNKEDKIKAILKVIDFKEESEKIVVNFVAGTRPPGISQEAADTVMAMFAEKLKVSNIICRFESSVTDMYAELSDEVIDEAYKFYTGLGQEFISKEMSTKITYISNEFIKDNSEDFMNIFKSCIDTYLKSTLPEGENAKPNRVLH